MDQQENEGELGDNASVEAPDPPQKTPEELAAEAEAAAIERTQQRLQQQCGSVDDAEEVCVFMVQDALNAVFEEMSVSSENTIVFARTSEWASNAVFSGTAMSSMMPQASLDRSSAGDAINAREARQQVLKLNDDHIDNASSQSEPSNSTVASRSTTPSLHLLRRLLEFLESSSTKASLELMGFTDTRYITRKSHTRNHQSTRSNIRGEWEIPCESMARFLEQLVKRCHVRVLPSTLNFVHKSTAALMETKARVNATVTLTQITHFVRKAILTAEEGAPAVAPSEKCKYESRTSWSQQTFQTEVNRRFSGESVTGSFQICFAEEVLPAGASLDRNAPGRIAMKAANPPKSPNQKQLARRVIMAMKPGPKSDSKWLGLRTKLVHDADPAVVQVNIDADMELNLHESPKPASDEVTTLSPKKPPAAPGAGASPAAARRGKSSSKSIAPSSNKERQVVTVSTAEPDTAALSNIFSLGTPRQLSADELSRRNDILAHLEREESQHQRRLANASIAAMTFPPNANPTCSEERAFHAYVAANSSITTGVDFNIQLPIPAAADISNETPPLPAAPRRPEIKNMNQSPNKRDRRSSKQTGEKSKFELACDPPSFAIRDGDTRASDKGDVSPYSPIRKLDSPGKLRSENISLSPVRPGQSPLAPHLPQLDTSRLAVGVRAVVRGVEKRGPRRNPSRQSRLKLHNYSVRAFTRQYSFGDKILTGIVQCGE